MNTVDLRLENFKGRSASLRRYFAPSINHRLRLEKIKAPAPHLAPNLLNIRGYSAAVPRIRRDDDPLKPTKVSRSKTKRADAKEGRGSSVRAPPPPSWITGSEGCSESATHTDSKNTQGSGRLCVPPVLPKDPIPPVNDEAPMQSARLRFTFGKAVGELSSPTACQGGKTAEHMETKVRENGLKLHATSEDLAYQDNRNQSQCTSEYLIKDFGEETGPRCAKITRGTPLCAISKSKTTPFTVTNIPPYSLGGPLQCVSAQGSRHVCCKPFPGEDSSIVQNGTPASEMKESAHATMGGTRTDEAPNAPRNARCNMSTIKIDSSEAFRSVSVVQANASNDVMGLAQRILQRDCIVNLSVDRLDRLKREVLGARQRSVRLDSAWRRGRLYADRLAAKSSRKALRNKNNAARCVDSHRSAPTTAQCTWDESSLPIKNYLHSNEMERFEQKTLNLEMSSSNSAQHSIDDLESVMRKSELKKVSLTNEVKQIIQTTIEEVLSRRNQSSRKHASQDLQVPDLYQSYIENLNHNEPSQSPWRIKSRYIDQSRENIEQITSEQHGPSGESQMMLELQDSNTECVTLARDTSSLQREEMQDAVTHPADDVHQSENSSTERNDNCLSDTHDNSKPDDGSLTHVTNSTVTEQLVSPKRSHIRPEEAINEDISENDTKPYYAETNVFDQEFPAEGESSSNSSGTSLAAFLESDLKTPSTWAGDGDKTALNNLCNDSALDLTTDSDQRKQLAESADMNINSTQDEDDQLLQFSSSASDETQSDTQSTDDEDTVQQTESISAMGTPCCGTHSTNSQQAELGGEHAGKLDSSNMEATGIGDGRYTRLASIKVKDILQYKHKKMQGYFNMSKSSYPPTDFNVHSEATASVKGSFRGYKKGRERDPKKANMHRAGCTWTPREKSLLNCLKNSHDTVSLSRRINRWTESQVQDSVLTVTDQNAEECSRETTTSSQQFCVKGTGLDGNETDVPRASHCNHFGHESGGSSSFPQHNQYGDNSRSRIQNGGLTPETSFCYHNREESGWTPYGMKDTPRCFPSDLQYSVVPQVQGTMPFLWPTLTCTPCRYNVRPESCISAKRWIPCGDETPNGSTVSVADAASRSKQKNRLNEAAPKLTETMAFMTISKPFSIDRRKGRLQTGYSEMKSTSGRNVVFLMMDDGLPPLGPTTREEEDAASNFGAPYPSPMESEDEECMHGVVNA